jgi:hypothetical protein
MKKCYAKELEDGPVFRIKEGGGIHHLVGKGGNIGKEWQVIGMFMKRKYAIAMMKYLTLEARKKT